MKKIRLAILACVVVAAGQAQARPDIIRMSDAEFTRFLRKQPLKAYENLPQNEKLLEDERINTRQSWVREFNRKNIEAMCASGGCSQGYQAPQRDVDRAEAYNAARYEFNLRRMGMTPSTAHKGMWALQHRPDSACAGYIRQLTGDADAPQDGPVSAFIQSDQMLIMSIERFGTCERRNVD